MNTIDKIATSFISVFRGMKKMTYPVGLPEHYLPIKTFLISHRALEDARYGIRDLTSSLQENTIFLHNWKVRWIGILSILRSSIELFKADANACINAEIRREIANEWKLIGDNRDQHPHFWEFLRKERNNVLHEYKWSAYEAYLDKENNELSSIVGLMGIFLQAERSTLLVKDGLFEGRPALDVLSESAQWAEDRIFAAIMRAGFDPEEKRSTRTFRKQPPGTPTLLSGAGD